MALYLISASDSRQSYYVIEGQPKGGPYPSLICYFLKQLPSVFVGRIAPFGEWVDCPEVWEFVFLKKSLGEINKLGTLTPGFR